MHSFERHTCEVVEAVVLEDLVQDAQELPHLGGDGLTGEAERQRQDLLIELCGGQEETVNEFHAHPFQHIMCKFTESWISVMIGVYMCDT